MEIYGALTQLRVRGSRAWGSEGVWGLGCVGFRVCGFGFRDWASGASRMLREACITILLAHLYITHDRGSLQSRERS